MFDVNIPEEHRVFSDGTSDGTQDKYFIDGYWYKLDRYGGEGMAEYLSYILLKYTNLNSDKYAVYEYGNINGSTGCRSKHFLKRGESLVTIYRLHYNVYGTSIGEVTRTMSSEERAMYTLNFMKKYTGLDLHEYFANTFWLDNIILNEDRHYNNLCVVFSQKEGFKEAPIFDNGKSLLVGNFSCKKTDPMKEKVKKVTARPFSGNHNWNYEYFRDFCNIKLDVDGLMNELNDAGASFEKDVLMYQIGKEERK